MNRCEKVFKRLDSRCILKKGHESKHAYPNALLKKEHPTLWDRLRRQDQYVEEDALYLEHIERENEPAGELEPKR